MKAIMISIKPEWVEKICNGEKIIEIRKTTPKCELPCKVYIYCTQGKMLHDMKNESYWSGKRFALADLKSNNIVSSSIPFINGKVVAEFTLNKVEQFSVGSLRSDDIEKPACLSYKEIIDYFYKPEELDGSHSKQGYAWHIEDLKIYDKPKELKQFQKDLDCDDYPCNKGKFCEYDYYDYSEGCSACGIDFDGTHCIYKQLKRPPQSWCYVEEEQDDKKE